ncbi:alpha/beta fold hydrolase [Lutimonas sp.]|uniref:alpha/beta fold hydrolase n=1 Tax=Lutimonas sp. TaxID=1872403 RepID=UPI003D9AE11E
MQRSLFKSIEGKKEVLNLYDEKLKALNLEVTSISVNTSFGETNILISGAENAPPIIVVHGSNGCAPIALETYHKLPSKFRVYAVDVLAQPNKSAEVRLSMKDASYGKWMNEIMQSLDVSNVTLAGFSFGGLVILKTLEYDESRVKEVFLSAPAYIVNGNPLKALFKIFIPMKRFIKTKNTRYIEKFLAQLFTDRDEFALRFLSSVFLNFTMDFSPVPLIKKERAQLIKTPISIFAAKHDLIFPGEKMIKRARTIFPSLKEAELLLNSKHVQNSEDNQYIEDKILATLKQ